MWEINNKEKYHVLIETIGILAKETYILEYAKIILRLKTRNIKIQFVAELNNIDYYKYGNSRFDLMWFPCSPI